MYFIYYYYLHITKIVLIRVVGTVGKSKQDKRSHDQEGLLIKGIKES